MFSKLDLAHAYQQLRLDADSRQYVTINTHKGLFRYTRPLFGVSTDPAIFQRTMEAIFRDLPHVSIYVDDILVTGESEAKHLQNLSAVLERLKAAGVRLKQEKCSFMMSEAEYLGHRISAKGLHPLPSKIRAIQEAPTPTEVSHLHSFLGLLGYYGQRPASMAHHKRSSLAAIPDTRIRAQHPGWVSTLGKSRGDPQARKRDSDHPPTRRAPRSDSDEEAGSRLCLVARDGC